jgi:SAM-dependent methyltransferase
MSDWNELYAKGETPWDKGINTPVLDVLLQKNPQFFRGRVLVPGCGLGHDARRLAAHGCEVVAIDIAPLAIERGKQLDPDHRVDFRVENLFELPEDLRGSFDLVWEHTCLCALEQALREKYVTAVRGALKPGGKVAGVFYMNPDMEPGESGPPFGITLEELIALWEKGGFEVDEHWVPEVAYEGRAGRERIMRLKKVDSPTAREKISEWKLFAMLFASAAALAGICKLAPQLESLAFPLFGLLMVLLWLYPWPFSKLFDLS